MNKMNKKDILIQCLGCEKLLHPRGFNGHLGAKHPEIYERYFQVRVDHPSWTLRTAVSWLGAKLQNERIAQVNSINSINKVFYHDDIKVFASYSPDQPRLHDPVNHPKHYTFGKYEVIDILQDWFPADPLLWQVVKYISRANYKGSRLEDLRKAAFYLQLEIEKEQNHT